VFFKSNTTPKNGVSIQKRDAGKAPDQNDLVDVYGKRNNSSKSLQSSVTKIFTESDDSTDKLCKTSLFRIPDSIAKLFHPNERGHEIISKHVLEAIKDARMKILEKRN
jgi:hypothetical protein